MRTFAKVYFGVYGLGGLAMAIQDVFTPERILGVTGWGHAPGWLREIACFDLSRPLRLRRRPARAGPREKRAEQRHRARAPLRPARREQLPRLPRERAVGTSAGRDSPLRLRRRGRARRAGRRRVPGDQARTLACRLNVSANGQRSPSALQLFDALHELSQSLHTLGEAPPDERFTVLGIAEEARTRNARDTDLLDQVTRKRLVVAVELEGREVRHDVVSAARLHGLEACLFETFE